MTMIWKTSLRNLTILIFSGTPLTFLKKGLIIAESPSFRQHPYRRFCPSSKTGMDCRSWNRFCKALFARASGLSTTVCKNHRLSAWPAAKVCRGKDRLFEGFRLPHPLPAESNCRRASSPAACRTPALHGFSILRAGMQPSTPPAACRVLQRRRVPPSLKCRFFAGMSFPNSLGICQWILWTNKIPRTDEPVSAPLWQAPWAHFFFRLRGKTKRGILIPAKEL